MKTATPLISAAVAAKTKNPQSAQVTNSILKSLTGGKILSLTDIHGNGLRLKVLRNHWKKSILIKRETQMKFQRNVVDVKLYK